MSIFLYLLAPLVSLHILHIGLRWRFRTRNTGDFLIKGSVVLKKRRVLDLTDLRSSVLDRVYEYFGKGITFQLVSSTTDQDGEPILGDAAPMEGWIRKLTSFNGGVARYNVTFNWDESKGIPGAVIVKNSHHYEFRLQTLTINGMPGKEQIHFVCDSWIYPVRKYGKHLDGGRIFFANDAYLPGKTPKALRAYREKELEILRGDGKFRDYKVHDRVYDYDTYNDLGEGSTILGGNGNPPYPRRGRTGPQGQQVTYLPRDEYFRHLKNSDFYAYFAKAVMKHKVQMRLRGREFRSFNDIRKLYGKLWSGEVISWLANHLIPFEFIRELVIRTDGETPFKFPIPQIIKNDDKISSWWMTDEEFARQMLAGLNPVLIRGAKNEDEIAEFMDERDNDGFQKKEAGFGRSVNGRVFFFLDHSEISQYQGEIYEHTKNKVYATKTLLRLKDGILKPYGICLISKKDNGIDDQKEYYFPNDNDDEKKGLWMLAKAFVAVNDSGIHQLVSHWLHTHAVIEPFVIAMNRCLSVMHPIHKLLSPHFRDTMQMNNMARHQLISRNGIIEKNFFPGSYGMKMTSEKYKEWNLMDHALPTDLLKRRVAQEVDYQVEDGKLSKKISLLIDDYPYAVDGLEIWSEIEKWVSNYCSIYYDDRDHDRAVSKDKELQNWWTEIQKHGHADLHGRTKWLDMKSKQDLIDTCTVIIWLTSAFHAAVNFGQYAYAGYVPNRPSLNRRQMPKEEHEIAEMVKDPEGYLLKTITAKPQALEIMETVLILSRHSSEEIYLGQRDDPLWTSDPKALLAFDEFHSRLKYVIETNIKNRNLDKNLKNRCGDVQIPYTLLYPNTSGKCASGLNGTGIPNSISI